jgi:hypothetical protein
MKEFRRNRSGQVLILAALAIAFIISSTIVYVYQNSHVLDAKQSVSANDAVRIVKSGSRNLVIGSLAKISCGGDNDTLGSNLERWSSFVESQYYSGHCVLSYDLCEDSPYSSGLWMSWGEDGLGVTSAKADFSMALTDGGTEISANYPVNVTSSISISGSFLADPPLSYNVSMIIHVRNEGGPALAKNLTVRYQNASGWWDVGELGSYSLADYGNGTYGVSFTVPWSWTYWVSASVYDTREILVQATLLL